MRQRGGLLYGSGGTRIALRSTRGQQECLCCYLHGQVMAAGRLLRQRDLTAICFVGFILVLVLITAAQVFIIQRSHRSAIGGGHVYTSRRQQIARRKLENDLREMDKNLRAMIYRRRNVQSLAAARRQILGLYSTRRIRSIIEDLKRRRKVVADQPRLYTSQQAAGVHMTSSDTLASTAPLHAQTRSTQFPHFKPSEENFTQCQNVLGLIPLMRSTPSAPESVITISSHGAQAYCPLVPPHLVGLQGHIMDLDSLGSLREVDIIHANPNVSKGGMWRPAQCIARHKVAIIVPFRDRLQHLHILLFYLHPVLQRQQIDYQIFVVEQYGRMTFNKAMLMNIAFVEAIRRRWDFSCFVFHDVDLVPEDDRNLYWCSEQPRHMSVAIDEMQYILFYEELVGGVLNMPRDAFFNVNGYSNLYWGWGAEDDDMAGRIYKAGYRITRPPSEIARYKMIKHKKRKPADSRKRYRLLYTVSRRFLVDGLNSLHYRVMAITERALYTHILADIGPPPKGFA